MEAFKVKYCRDINDYQYRGPIFPRQLWYEILQIDFKMMSSLFRLIA